MADKNDAIEVEALLVPELGDMGEVERQLSKKLSAAAKPLVDTLSNAKVGLDPRALKKAQKDLDAVGASLSSSFDRALEKVLTQDRSVLRSPKSLKNMAKTDADIAHLINVLGGYSEASKVLASPDAQRRLQSMSQAFKGLNDVAFQIGRLPSVDAKTQKLLSKLYQSNTADSFKKLNETQQRQVRDALAVLDLQDKAFTNLKNSLAKAGLGVAATDINKALKERRINAQRLERVTSPEALAKLEKAEKNQADRAAKAKKLQAEKQKVLDARAARSRAISEEKDRVLGRTGGISGLKDPQDIAAVRRGLNRDYNLAVQQLAVDAIGPGGKGSKAYAATEGRIASTRQLRAELKNLEEAEKAASRAAAQSAKDAEKLRVQQEKDAERARKAAAAQEEKDAQVRTKSARNMRQARAILKESGGSFEGVNKEQVRTLRPYLQDRFNSRSRFAESVGNRYGTDSPEFARAAGSAQQYARALGELDTRARQLRPALDDVAQITRAFFRYALGYGALYEMLNGVTALTRGLVDLDEQLYNIQAITLSTDAQMRSIESAIKQTGLTTKFTLNEVAEGAQILAQAGTAPEKIPAQLQAVADFAAATNSSLAQSADLLTSFTNVYKEIGDGKAADLLTKTLNLSKLQGEDLRTIISYTAQTAEGYNISAENLLGAVATLRNVGIKPSTIATGLRQAMLEVFNPDKKLTEALAKRYEQLGESVTNEQIAARFDAFQTSDNPLLSAVAELRRIGFGGEASNLFSRAFDVRAFNPLKALVNNFDQFSALSTQVGIGQSAAEASEIQLKSLRATLENLGASVIAFSDSIGGDMVRSLQTGAQAAADLIQRLTELDQTLKADTGEGLASTVSTGLLGGAAGALLGGRGFLNRAGGFATGAIAAGGFSAAGKGEEAGASDYAIPALAALITIVPSLLDFMGGLKGRAGEIREAANRMKAVGKVDVASTLGPALTAGSFLSDLVSGFGRSGAGGAARGLAGLGAFGVLRIGVGVIARAVPIIGLIWTAYELLSLFNSSGKDIQDAVDKARNQAQAAGDRLRAFDTKAADQKARVAEYDIDRVGGPEAGTTAAQLTTLKTLAENIDLSVKEIFNARAGELGEADKILKDYVTRTTTQRQSDLEALRKLGYTAEDRQLYDISAQMEELNKGVEAVRKDLLADLTRATEQLVEAGGSGDSEAIQAALQRQRVLNELPELREVIYNRASLPAEQILELYTQYSRQLAEEAKKGTADTADRIALVVKSTVSQLDSIALSAEQSPEIRDSAQQLVTSLATTEDNVVAIMDSLAAGADEAAAKLEAQAKNLMDQAATAERLAEPRINPLTGIPQAYPGMQERAVQLRAKAAGLNRQAQGRRDLAQFARGESVRAGEFDAEQLARAEEIAAGNQSGVAEAIAKGLFTPEFFTLLSAKQAELVRQVGDPAQRQELVNSGKFSPIQKRTGEYAQAPLSSDLEKILQANQRFWAAQTAQTAAEKKEREKAGYLSDPRAQVELADLQNKLREAERRRDYETAKGLTESMFKLQEQEQAKAVKRAEKDLSAVSGNKDKDDTNARERVASEQAKLISLRGDMSAKLKEYQDKIDELDLKRRTVEINEQRRRTESAFNESVSRGDVAGAMKYSQQYEEIQAKALELAKKELALKGYSADQIQLEIRTRGDLTTTLIDQENAQNRLTQAVIARADFEARMAGKGPSTGNRAVDGFLESSGIGFTQEQEKQALERDLSLYIRQVQTLQAEWAEQSKGLKRGTEEASKAEQQYATAMEEVQYKIGQTAGALQQLRNGPWNEIKEAFDLTGLLNQLQQSQYVLNNLGENLRSGLGQAMEDLGTVFTDTVRNSGELAKILGYTRDEAYSTRDALREVVNSMAEQAFQTSSKTLFNSALQGGINLVGKGFNALTGKEGDVADGKSAENKAKSGLGSILGSLFGGDAADAATATGTMNVTAQTVNVGDSGMGGLGGGDAAVGEQLQDKVGGPLSAGFELLRGKFDQLKGAFGEVGSMLWSGLVNIVTAIFTASAAEQTTSAAGAFAAGGMPSRVIKGKKSSKRDNLVATADVGGKKVPIAVEADEGILNRKAMELIGGEQGLNAINSGQLTRVQASATPVAASTSGTEVVAQRAAAAPPVVVPPPEVAIINVGSNQQMREFVESRPGIKVIINELRKEGVV